MDTAQLALILKFVLALVMVLAGILALVFGYKLYMKGVGLKADGTTVDIKNIKLGLQTVGAVVMATSIAWGGLGYLASPSYSGNGQIVNVASVPVPKLQTPLPAGKTDVAELSNDQLAELFKNAATASVFINKNVSLIDQPATKTYNGQTGVESAWKLDGSNIGEQLKLWYVPKVGEDKTLIFEPRQATVNFEKPSA